MSHVDNEPSESAVPSHESSGSSFWALVVLLVAASALLVVLQRGRPDRPAGAFVGLPMPPLDAGGWINTSGPLAADDLRGQVVLVDFWATWCGPCLAELPKLIEFHKKYGDRVAIVGLTREDGASAQIVKNFVETRDGMDWPVGYGAHLAFDVIGIAGIPTYILYDRSGRSVWGGHSLRRLEDEVVKVLAADGAKR